MAVNGTGAFPASASVDLAPVLASVGGSTVFDTAKINLDAVTGVAALDASDATAPTSPCTNLSAPVNCRDYNLAGATLDLHSAAISGLTTNVNTILAGADTTVDGLSSTISTALFNTVTGLVDIVGGTSDLNVTVNADLEAALAPVLAAPITVNGVTLDPSTGTISVNLATLTGQSLDGRDPNSVLLDAGTLTAVSTAVSQILTQLQGELNTELAAAVNSVPVTISGGVTFPGGPTVGGTLGLSYDGTLGDLLSGATPIDHTESGVIGTVLGAGVGTLSDTLQAAVSTAIEPILTNLLSTTGTALDTATTGLGTTLQPALTAIGSLAQVIVNVQEPGTAAGSYREVAVRVSLLGSNLGTLDLGRAEVGPNAAAPVVAALTPDRGPVAGGTSVTISGTGLGGATSITVDGQSVTFTDNHDGTLTFTTPAHAAGAVDVVVTTPNGTAPPATFTYVPAPANLTLTPNRGPTAGGTNVTITGDNLTGATAVDVDGTSTPFTQHPDGSITFATPAHAAGPVDVTVTTAAGGPSAPATFTYYATPVISTLQPNSGPTTGGTSVTITGTGFNGATRVTIAGTSVPFTNNGDGTLTFTTPAHAAGPVAVTVTTPGGASAPQTFTYLTTPVITGLDPAAGPTAGGNPVTISGTGLDGATAVTVAGQNVLFTQHPDGTITITMPPHAAGTVPVTVTTPNGTSASANYIYRPTPVIAALTPNHGPTYGGNTVTISGDGLQGATAVSVAGTSVPFRDNGDGTLAVTMPAHAAGTAAVAVTTPGGVSAPVSYRYTVEPPVITGINPSTGSTSGGTTVTISGDGLGGATSVSVDGDSVPFTDNGDGTLTITTPRHAAGTVDITVTAPYGTSNAAHFRYATATVCTASPTIASIDPNHGPTSGGTSSILSGSGFTGTTQLNYGDTAAASFTVVSDREIITVSPRHTAGTVEIILTTPCGTADPAFTFEIAGGSGTGAAGLLATTGQNLSIGDLLLGLGTLIAGAGAIAFTRRHRRTL